MSTPARCDVVVVGAGLAGLTAADRLTRDGLEVIVIESSDSVGGRVRTDQVGGFLLDRGFQVLNTGYPAARRILDLDALDLREFRRAALLYVDGRRYGSVTHGGSCWPFPARRLHRSVDFGARPHSRRTPVRLWGCPLAWSRVGATCRPSITGRGAACAARQWTGYCGRSSAAWCSRSS